MVAQIKADRSPATLLPVQRGKAPMHIITAPHRSLYAEVKAQALRLAGQGTPVLIVEFFQGGAQQGLALPRVLGQNLTWMRCNTQRRLDRLPPDTPPHRCRNQLLSSPVASDPPSAQRWHL
ncbi:MAG: hypothetical protein HC919_00210 [Oscillatoriales cyanobacterium SM2_2_1]|nr:hypothetical protein [Oscillatoriales cyanobacterium SM2_2_1]